MVAMNAPIRIRIGADIERPPERPHPQQLPNINADADADADAALALAAEDVIHVTGSSLGRLIGGALIVRMRMRDPASSIRSIALSGRCRSWM